MPARTNTISRFSWLGSKPKTRPSILEPLQPPPHIADAFQSYIHNEVPTRLIDTSNLTFVERDAVFNVFRSEIAQVTDQDVEKRISTHVKGTDPEAAVYVKPFVTALQETIRAVVQYAIFSHRWTDSEPTYQDVSALAGPGLSKRRSRTDGLDKLAQLCETARSLGYKLVWSDTCCIDKANPAELSEAIHAMYRWYAHSHVCIVHLGASLSLSDFECDPWFKRGWTLQELLAPRRIKFYDRQWGPFTGSTNLNDKEDPALMSALSSVTGIPRDVVTADNSGGIKGHSVWEIMSWASTRETTRIEDTAYCLYGLFDINIPITYGEGEKAFPRLVRALVERHPRWDVFAWAGQASKINAALPSSPVCYSKWNKEMMEGKVGMMGFTLFAHELRLMSVPLIPLKFASETKEKDGPYTVTLRPRTAAMRGLGTYSDVAVVCGAGRLQHLREATDLHACILNYKPSRRGHRERGKLQVRRGYVCFLLHMERRDAEEPTWLKFATDNLLRISCEGTPVERGSPERASEPAEESVFTLPLRSIYIRAPRAQTLWV